MPLYLVLKGPKIGTEKHPLYPIFYVLIVFQATFSQISQNFLKIGAAHIFFSKLDCEVPCSSLLKAILGTFHKNVQKYFAFIFKQEPAGVHSLLRRFGASRP